MKELDDRRDEFLLVGKRDDYGEDQLKNYSSKMDKMIRNLRKSKTTLNRKMQSGGDGDFELGRISDMEITNYIYDYLEFLFERMEVLPENYHDVDSRDIMKKILGTIFTYTSDDSSEIRFTGWQHVFAGKYNPLMSKALEDKNIDEWRRLYKERNEDPEYEAPIDENARLVCEMIIPLHKSLKRHLNLDLMNMTPTITPDFLVDSYVYMALVYEMDLDIETIIDDILTDRKLA
jgi:hypothetical protein